ncbi:aldehyde dehydrogenase [Xylanimonas ulmi]|uniref:Aminomuconate-semialdehyde/2-hydroxymuconate-6-semialdehyde dehydrogenase n=1 Tax=Xylanimonas ulmi TaxID=228973 RepID=A0A4Q7M100_9MICO|nr:aldehyde dehydrogenase [Xylanibacterium ulmi]RZS61465.1 aminomuconate-semialdehyde/2-hydroxymuconate-6-semialdehyde dehydrogenase [Xylanibacterium ulmi]
MTEFFGHVIDGQEVESADGRRFDTVNPYTRQAWAQVPLGGRPEASAAIAAARRAFDDGPWPRRGPQERQAVLRRFAELMVERADELARADTLDMGKPTAQALADVERSAWNIRFFADHQALSCGDQYPMDGGHHAYSLFQPAGVVVAIAPWNFPLMMATWKIAPALAWGNTVVLKPSEFTPTSVVVLARLALEAGIPPGVLNVVHGFGTDSVGEFLTDDDRVDRITFTGESRTGNAIMGAAAKRLIPVSLELGGKGANIVFDDAELENATDWAVQAIFRNAGQVCLAGSRLFLQRGVAERFLERFTGKAEALVMGDPQADGTEFGPLSSDVHHAKVKGYVETVERDGGRILTGGMGEGWFVKPTIVVDLPLDAPQYREEIFGPVVVVNVFDTEDEVVRLANDTPYGLNAMVFTESLSRAHRVAGRLKAGTVWVNCFFIRDLRAPFGGVGASGVGREGGNFSREFFTEPKAVVMQVSRESGA